MSDTKYNHLQQCACMNIRKTSRIITQLFDHALQPAGIKVTQFSILGVLANTKEVTLNELAANLDMDRTTLTRSLVRLEEDQVVRSREGEDARQRKIELTKKGYELLETALPYWEEAQSVMLHGLGSEFPDFLNSLKQGADIAANRS